MKQLPGPPRLSLPGVLARLAKSRSALASRDEVKRSLYWALRDGALTAVGDVEDRDGNIQSRDLIVSPEHWRLLSEADFGHACYRPRVVELTNNRSRLNGPLFLINVTIATSELDEWLATGTDSNDPGKSMGVPPKREQLDEVVARLAEWIFSQHSDPKDKNKLQNEARTASLGTFTTVHFTEAYQRVYETRKGRPPVTGWPLTAEFRCRLKAREQPK